MYHIRELYGCTGTPNKGVRRNFSMSFPVKNIRALCKKRGTSLAALERSLGFGNGVIAGWETAKSYPPYDRVSAVAAVPLSAANKKPHLFRCGFFLHSARLQFFGMLFAGIVLPRPQTRSCKMPAPRRCDAVHRTPRCTGLPLVVTQKIGSMR